MTRFIFLSLGFAAPTLAMVLVAAFSWHEGRKERRRTVALRQWLRAQG
jgi:hypothetical protein